MNIDALSATRAFITVADILQPLLGHKDTSPDNDQQFDDLTM